MKITSAQRLALTWILALALESMLALRTVKTRLTYEGLPAGQALDRATVWEAAHIILIGLLIPAWVICETWRYLRHKPVASWTGKRIAVAWAAVAVTAYCASMTESVVAETILPTGAGYAVPVAYALYVAVAAAALALTVVWVRKRTGSA